MFNTQPVDCKTIIKFLALLAILVGYFFYLGFKYDFVTGGIAAALTWSFFVLCTPIADAGFLLDFPLRLLFGVRMVVAELCVWTIAISLNLLVFFGAPTHYETTALTQIFHMVLSTPYPYWAIIALSAVGTFLSVKFGDELFDTVKHRNAPKESYLKAHHWKHELVMIAFFAVVIFVYYDLAASLGLEQYIAH